MMLPKEQKIMVRYKRLNTRTAWNRVGGATIKRKQCVWSGMQWSHYTEQRNLYSGIFGCKNDFLSTIFSFYLTSDFPQSPKSETWEVRLNEPKTRVKELRLERLCRGSLCQRAAWADSPHESGQDRSRAWPQQGSILADQVTDLQHLHVLASSEKELGSILVLEMGAAGERVGDRTENKATTWVQSPSRRQGQGEG